LCAIYHVYVFRAVLDVLECVSWRLLFLSRFLKISRNRLAALKVRQATHATSTYFSGFDMHPLAARCCPPGDTNWVVQFLRVLGLFAMLDVWVNL